MIKTVKIIIFFVSFGMVYPHIFAGDDEITVTCEKCGTKVEIASDEKCVTKVAIASE